MRSAALLKKETSKNTGTTDGKATNNPLQLKQGSLSNMHNPVIQRVSDDELLKIAERTGFKSADKLRTFLKSKKITDQVIAEASEQEIDEFLQIYKPTKEEENEEENEPTARDIVNDKLKKNDFRITAGLDQYEQAFGANFSKELMELKESDRWLDGGAGLGVAIHDYYKKKEGKAKTTSIGVARPTTENSEHSKIAKELDEDNRFDYLSGKLFLDMSEKEELKTDAKKINIISDYNGVLSYTQTLSEDMQKYLRILEVGGKIYTNFYATIKKNEEKISELEWLQECDGIESEKKGDILIIKKINNDTKVKTLSLISEENISTNKKPNRTYKMSS